MGLEINKCHHCAQVTSFYPKMTKVKYNTGNLPSVVYDEQTEENAFEIR